MTRPTRHLPLSLGIAGALALLAGSSGALLAQADDDPRDERGRRIVEGMTTKLAFREVSVSELISFITETTGKVVLPRREVLSREITLISDTEIPQERALDLVFLALQQEGIAVVETRDVITLRDFAEVDRQDVPVISAESTTLGRTDYGTVAEKVFRLTHATAEDVSDLIDDTLPDYANVGFNEQSNTIVVMGNIGLLQRVERLVNSIDQPSASSLETRTFMLRYADSEEIAQNIRDLFEDDGSGNNDVAQAQAARRFFQRGGGGGDVASASASPSANLRVTANVQQNSVTVLAETDVIEEVASLIATVWDTPVEAESVVPKVYTLYHTDPVRVQALLEGLFGEASANEEGGGTTAGATRLAGQFSFQAQSDAGQLVVVAKSPDNLFVIDEIIAELDQPQSIGLPEIVELKHADAEELAEQLNALLADRGTLAQIPRQERGLQLGGTSESPFASGASDDAAEDDEIEFISFWWQQGQDPGDARPTSSLVGRIRIVPVWRQNAVMITSPPEYRAAIRKLVTDLDRPGRQVLIRAVVAEISLEDALAVGLRWSSQNIIPNQQDNSFSVGTTTTGQQNNLLPGLFDTSVLDLNADLNLILQALDQNTDLNILSEPKIFTSDNQEAEFFDGQDIPFVTDSQTTDQGTLTQTTEYRAVGIQLSVRPRITPNRDVDLRVNLELSSIQPTLTAQGQFIVDRRETTTQLIVGDGQTIVISGILRSEDRDVVRKFPILGDIPLIGLLFTSRETTTEKTELVAFVTPYVIENDQDLRRVNEPYLNRLDALRELLESPDDNLEPEDVSLLDEPAPAPLAPGELNLMDEGALRQAFRDRAIALEREDLSEATRARLVREQVEIQQRLVGMGPS